MFIASMANALNAHEGKSPSVYTPEVVLRDASGPSPAFGALLAESDGEVVGYATCLPGYNSDLGVRSMFLLSSNPLESPPDELLAVRVLETWVGGERVHTSG